MKYLLMLLTINAIGIMIALSGCTSTGSTIVSDDTIKVLTEAVSKLDKEQVKKLETAIKEKLNDENSNRNDDLGGTGAGNSKTEETKQETQVEDKNIEGSKSLLDVSDVSALNWTSSGDPHHIVQCYFGHGHDSELFKMVAQLPVDFTCALNNGGVSISPPASDDSGRMMMYEGDHMQKRRAFVCLFDANNNLVDCWDWAESYSHDNRWKDKPVSKGLVIHCKRGNAVSRTSLTEVMK